VSEIIEAYQVPSESLDVRFLVFEGESIECSGLIGIDGLGRKQGDENKFRKVKNADRRKMKTKHVHRIRLF